MMYYTVGRLQIDNGQSADPVHYIGRHHEILGRELSAFMFRHDLDTGESRRMGDTTRYGHHAFFLTYKPTIDDLIYWNAVKENAYPVIIDASGGMTVLDHNSHPFSIDTQYSSAPNKTFAQQQKRSVVNSRAEKLIKKYLK